MGQMKKLSGKLLVANRGEIATRIFRTAAELELPTVAVFSSDDASSLHTRKADEAYQLPGRGVAAYLDVEAIINAAKATGATMIHPGYGFLSENPELPLACKANDIIFVGPSAEAISLFGDKHRARTLAEEQGVPVIPGTSAPTSLEEARHFLAQQGDAAGIMVKAVAGGGGRGIRPVTSASELDEAFTRAASEAESGFGNGDLFVEKMITDARHIEVQILGDGSEVSHLWERDCSLQRRRQKLLELAPAPYLNETVRQNILDAAMRLVQAVGYQNLGTVEFLLDRNSDAFYFIEVNPRIQVEHTVTEEITGLDLVELQLRLAQGFTLADLELTTAQIPEPRGTAMQLRINTEKLSETGETKPASGLLNAFDMPAGRGIRVDSYAYTGYRTNPSFDPLLAKLIVHSSSRHLEDVLHKGYRALCECHIAGVSTNLGLLQALVQHPVLSQGPFNTDFVSHHTGELITAATESHPQLYFDMADTDVAPSTSAAKNTVVLPEGHQGVYSPYQGTVVSVDVSAGEVITAGQQLAVLEAMKMEHVITAKAGGLVTELFITPGDILDESQLLLAIETDGDVTLDELEQQQEVVDLDAIRPDLAEILERKAKTLDENRPEAVAKRRKRNQRTARENLSDLIDEGSFVEYGALTLAAQRRRRSIEDLVERSPADGIITGVAQINGDLFDAPDNRAAVMTYDFTVFAGTQGVHNHWKTDRLIDIAEQGRMPMVVFAEGGGGRPGDDDYEGFPGIDTFNHFSRLSALVPIVSIVSGRCFAGNAALLGLSDVIIATQYSNIGMGGPAMVEGGGLGVVSADEIGPSEIQASNGVIDILVEDEAEAVAVAKKYLSYFQGTVKDWKAPDQRAMRTLVPENRLRVYEVRRVIETLADEDSMLELRAGFGRNMVTALIRIEGRPVGVIANDPKHMGGAIDSDAADKAARFMQLCDSFDIPLLNFCDTPGIMVGPEVEKTALVRHAARMFLAGSNLSVPLFTVALRKAYGLGAGGMAGGDIKAPVFAVSWPTGEFGAMGLEGQIRLGYKAELEAVEDPQERKQLFDDMVAMAYQTGKALVGATRFDIDDVIDPADTRFWLSNILASMRPPAPRDGKKRPMIDSW
ncbi:carboxyl transferase domain-containing protein [Maricurvus nonylphenolicus]|uniref:carboxyl transferase domain-containing protein n=1 Tax=Maricurvus nonylphenolicus TaxID=1008307 RepID=UPI0036F381F2